MPGGALLVRDLGQLADPTKASRAIQPLGLIRIGHDVVDVGHAARHDRRPLLAVADRHAADLDAHQTAARIGRVDDDRMRARSRRPAGDVGQSPRVGVPGLGERLNLGPRRAPVGATEQRGRHRPGVHDVRIPRRGHHFEHLAALESDVLPVAAAVTRTVDAVLRPRQQAPVRLAHHFHVALAERGSPRGLAWLREEHPFGRAYD